MVYNGMRYIPKSVASMVNQTYPDCEVVCVINGNDDHGKEYIQEHFPTVRIIDPKKNLRFVRGHNLIFNQLQNTEFFQLVNQDLYLEPNYVEEVVKAFEDPRVAGANGKIYQYDWDQSVKSQKLDTTGIDIYKTGRARSRGQNEVDQGQFDDKREVMAVDGAACMYRRSALEVVKYPKANGQYEYFDEDFEMYWEDVDLSWRFINAGFACRFVPSAIGYHGRTAASSPGGYKKLFSFIKHHNKIPRWILKFNYKNHLFLYIKNSPKFYWQFFARELFYNAYVLVFETSTLSVWPELIRQFPKIWKKRKYIQAHRKITVAEVERLFAVHSAEIKK